MTAMTARLDLPGFLPRLSSQHLPRTRLTEPLLASSARVKLICAPAGSGKSALALECLTLAPEGCGVHWLPLTGVALSPAELCAQLAYTFGLGLVGESQVLLHVSRIQTPTWVFLDDYSRVPTAELDLLLDRLLAASSPALTWWLNGRRRPQCNWPRLLLEGELYEFDAQALAFDQREIQKLIEQQPRPLPVQAAGKLFQVSAGWCAGVRIALLETTDWAANDGRASCLRSTTLVDYLQHELFATLTPELAEAWRVLAHLPMFCTELCEHLFGAGEGGQWLRLLQELGCFIEPAPDRPQWLQVFPPLAQLLRAEPWPAGRSWHRRACQWFTAQEDWQAAVEQALAAQEYEVVASLLQNFSFEHLFQRQNVLLLLRLYEEHADDLMLGTPQLVGLITSALLFAGRFEHAAQCIEQLARFAPQPTAAAQRHLLARWQALRGWLLHLDGRAAPAREHFLQALNDLPPAAWPARLFCLSGLTQQALLDSHLDQAHALNREALCLARAQDSLVFEALLELDHAQLLEQRGALQRSETLLENVHALLSVRPHLADPLLGRIALRQGRLALRQGRDQEAEVHLHTGLEHCLRSQDKRALYGFLGLAELDARRGDYAQAFVRLRDAERLMQQRQIPDTVYRAVLLQVSSQFWLQQGRVELVQEALTRLLRHFRGPDAVQAPPATLELIPRVEYLLLLANVYAGKAHEPIRQLTQWLEQARGHGLVGLEADLLLALAEVAFLGDQKALAKSHLSEGLALVVRCHLHQSLSELRMRQPGLMAALGLEEAILMPSENPLSQRELEVLKLIALGSSNQQIAEQLFISLHTVKTHARRIHSKLGVERRTQAVAKAKGLGLMQ